MKVVIDPGHGGSDTGAVGFGLREADVALQLAELVGEHFGKYEGAVVTFTRNRNTSSSYPAPPAGLRKRIAYANNTNGAHGNPAKNDSQAARSRIAVLRDTKMSAVLLECLFIDNAKEIKLLCDRQFLDGLAKAIVKGVAAAFGLKEKVNKPKPMYRVMVDGKEAVDTAYESKINDTVTRAISSQKNEITIRKIM
ncbi:hypothetical protein ADL26_15095 [Thermoactinomyces vulgaris]|nr:hypothetical protein ADL26_15095 [Thermoactinomyces vulgaris]